MPKGKSNREVKKYQASACKTLGRIFGDNSVREEWDAAKDSGDAFTRELYSPRLDIAVGPFNIDGNVDRNNERIRRVFYAKENFIKEMLRCSERENRNARELFENRNKNPRCFLAIEIENSGSSKHMLGNIANVSILGSIGIVIPFNDKKMHLCKRIKKYVTFATKVEKIKDVFKNVLIIDFIFILECVAGLRDKKILDVRLLSPPEEGVLAGDFLVNFGAFFSKDYRVHDFNIGREVVRQFLTKGKNRDELRIDLSKYNPEKYAYDKNLNDVTIKSVPTEQKIKLRDTLVKRADSFVKNILKVYPIGFLARIGIPLVLMFGRWKKVLPWMTRKLVIKVLNSKLEIK